MGAGREAEAKPVRDHRFMSSAAYNDTPLDSEAQWSSWVSTLPETTRRVLTDPASDRESVYRGLMASRRVSPGAILLELFTLEETGY